MSYDYNLFAIGAGSGGLAAAKRAAACGLRVAIAERDALGGTCVNRGCVPKKLLVYAADIARQDALATGYGWSECQRQLNWSQLLAAIHQHIEKLNQSYQRTLQQAGIELFQSEARFLDPHTLQVGDRKVTADKIVIAVGGHPIKPNIPGKELAVTSREMFHLKTQPKQLAIIGGGYIGVEFSSIMQAMGCEVTLMELEEQILPGFDRDIRTAVQEGLSERGIRLLTETTAKEIVSSDEGLQLHLTGKSQETLTADTVLIATSRAPNTQNLGLEEAGVEVCQNGAVRVDEYSRTTQETIFAIGDCTDRIQLTPVAIAQGKAVVETAFGDSPQSVDYSCVPSAVFVRPEAATVGMTESEARDKYGESVHCYRTSFKPLLYSLTQREERVTMKLVVEGEQERVIGAHMVGEHAADIIQSLAVAIAQGTTKQNLDRTIGIHPTTGEEFLTLD
jgi:glutathione reductase (NADPH)